MDWIALGALILGGISGYATRSRKGGMTRKQRREEEREKAILPRCLCSHWFNEHKAGGGECLYGSKTRTEIEEHPGYSVLPIRKNISETCVCVGYIGPDPLVFGFWQGDGLKGEQRRH